MRTIENRVGQRAGDRAAVLASIVVAAAGCGYDDMDAEVTEAADPRGTVPDDTAAGSDLAALHAHHHNGKLGSLIPFHKDAIHATILWDRRRDPWLCFWMRPSEYKGVHLVDPNAGPLGELRNVFQELVYGGFGFSGNLDESVKTRIKDDIYRDNVLCLDLEHPDALWESGKYAVADLTPADFDVNADAFHDAGHSAGLDYNLFCAGHVTLKDGRLAVFGGHDKAGNYGIDTVSIFDIDKWSWVHRRVPRVKTAYLADPTNSDPGSHPSALDERYTDPRDPSDLKYQRWYPSTVLLPDGKVLVLSGTDQDSSKPRDEAAATKVRQGVHEVWDPERERTIALESAHKLLAMYPRSYLVWRGPGRHDWKVAVNGIVSAIPDDLSAYDPFPYSGETYYFDVRAALADPRRHRRAERHWRYVTTGKSAHNSGAGAQIWELDHRGLPKKQQVALFGGDSGAGSDEVATVEMIDHSDRHPRWEEQEPLAQPVQQNHAVVLPNGKVVVFGGRGGTPATNNYQIQLFDPDTGKVKTVATTTVPRHDHATGLLLPDGKVAMMGGNRVQLVPGNADAGVPVAELYKPAYLFRGPRPVIKKAPKRVEYGDRFEIELRHRVDIDKISIVRTGPVTHNWDWTNRYVRLAFQQHGKKLRVVPPKYPAITPPGDYMLFVLDDKGVPSKAELIRLED